MGDEFNDLSDINIFEDPSVVRATASAKQQVSSLTQPQSGNFQYSQPIGMPLFETLEYGTPTNITAEVEDFKRKQQELERREEELRRREAQMLSSDQNSVKKNNFPPLPSFIPLAPCFYMDIDEEIPPQNVLLCKQLYLKLKVYCCLLLVNIFGMGLFLGTEIKGVTVSFVVSFILAALFIPLSFVFCYRSAYQALK